MFKPGALSQFVNAIRASGRLQRSKPDPEIRTGKGADNKLDREARIRPSRRHLPPIEPSNDMARLLLSGSPPLIHPQGRFIVIFSEKSACTNVVIWFLTQLGHAKAARDFHEWPHEYRISVYYQSQLYQNALRSDLSDFRIVRVIRDPFDRAVSSFRHVLRFNIIDHDINLALEPRSIEQDGLSFAEFLDFLDGVDLQNCNPHFSIQRHPLEDFCVIEYLINISRESLFDRLNEIEAALGLTPTALKNDSWVQRLVVHNRPRRELAAEKGIFQRRFTRKDARQGPWPHHELFLTAAARAKITRLYHKDVEAYVNE